MALAFTDLVETAMMEAVLQGYGSLQESGAKIQIQNSRAII